MSSNELQPCTSNKQCLIWYLSIGAGVLTAGILYWTVPLQYEAKVLLLVHSVKPSLFIESATPPADYDRFINNQIELICTPGVIDTALENIEMASLPYLQKQHNRREWLTKKIKIQRNNVASEIISISFKSEVPEAAEKILNAVVDSYLLFVASTGQDFDRALLGELQNEKKKYITLLQNLYHTIQAKEKEREKGHTLQEDTAKNDEVIVSETWEATLETLLEKDQWERIKKHLSRIDDQIFTMQIGRDTLSRIMPLSRATFPSPLRMEKFMIVGISAVIVALVPLCLNFLFRRFCNHRKYPSAR